METIRLTTWIDAPVERCFLLSLSIDLHARSTRQKAVDGVTEGLIDEGQWVTFRSRRLGLPRRHTTRMEIVRPYSYFRDVMTKGPFRHFEHDHHFARMDDGTRIRDEIRFSAKWGSLGRLASKTIVRRRLVELLTERNDVIKRVAESEMWRKYLESEPFDRIPPSSAAARSGQRNRNSLLHAAHGAIAPPRNS